MADSAGRRPESDDPGDGPSGPGATCPGGATATGRRRRLPWKPRSALTPRGLARRKLTLRGALAAGLLGIATLGYSVGDALTYPGDDSTAARLAGWAREHELGAVVDKLENLQYELDPPQVGGSLPNEALARMRATAPAVPVHHQDVPLRAPMRPLVAPGLPGEGVWRVLSAAHGEPVVQGTYVRPDRDHTSYQAAVAWIDGRRARFELHPGVREPGGTFSVPPTIPQGRRTGLLATWNGGFKVTDGGSRGGFYLAGDTAGELRDGAASEVFYRDGSIKVGQWGRDVGMTREVVGVRQCLELMVDDGKVVPGIDIDSKWGATDQSRMFVERSGVGVTARGDVIMVVGQALTARTLADLMQRAGAVRAMPLDMNRAWPSFMSYDPAGDPANPKPVNLLDFDNPPERYYTRATRDFVAVYAK
ncbi:phosphodiester glycosidase family protein [Streptomyces sp. ASQP_92]|uniref:phosphodiester glycosidase family protein n=1 Tax=Streptomyces sp. ASQP_92 TaxID=2979116 RepID=UPI0021C05E75|nr:phosphodiester glycosidase family protein [Streptomyces sp. ASQP_92]MCT9092394.1 phosphodiester glycosidase family protein [Streptomyces sp. ASQP_92]